MKRRRKNLAFWSKNYKSLDINSFKEREREYVKLWIDPYYRLYKVKDDILDKKNPPHWFKKLILKELIDIYLEWRNQLEPLKEPYYLKIWLGDPEFMDSQIVAAKGEQIKNYESLFKENPNPKSFPKDKFNLKHPDLSLFEWKNYLNGYEIYESEVDSLEELEKIKSIAHSFQKYEIQGKMEKCYFIPQGDMWVGEIPKQKI